MYFMYFSSPRPSPSICIFISRACKIINALLQILVKYSLGGLFGLLTVLDFDPIQYIDFAFFFGLHRGKYLMECSDGLAVWVGSVGNGCC